MSTAPERGAREGSPQCPTCGEEMLPVRLWPEVYACRRCRTSHHMPEQED